MRYQQTVLLYILTLVAIRSIPIQVYRIYNYLQINREATLAVISLSPFGTAHLATNLMVRMHF